MTETGMRNNAQSINTQLTGFIQATLHNWGIEQVTKREHENTFVYAGDLRLMPRCGSIKLGRSVFIENSILLSTRGTLYAVGLMGEFSPEDILLVDSARMFAAVSDSELSWPEDGRIGFSKQKGYGFYHGKLRNLGAKSLSEVFK